MYLSHPACALHILVHRNVLKGQKYINRMRYEAICFELIWALVYFGFICWLRVSAMNLERQIKRETAEFFNSSTLLNIVPSGPLVLAGA